MIKNRIQEELDLQGRSEKWLREEYNHLTDDTIRELTYYRLKALRDNEQSIQLTEIVYIAEVLGLGKQFPKLISNE